MNFFNIEMNEELKAAIVLKKIGDATEDHKLLQNPGKGKPTMPENKPLLAL